MLKKVNAKSLMGISIFAFSIFVLGNAVGAWAEPSVHAVGVISGVRPENYQRNFKRIFAKERASQRALRRRYADKGSKAHSEAILALVDRRNDALARLSRRNPGTVRVEVSAASAPMILVLTSLQAVTWDIALQPGASLERVLLSSDEPSAVKDERILSGVPIEYFKGTFNGRFFGFHEDDREQVYVSEYNEARQTYVCTDRIEQVQQSALTESIDVIKSLLGKEPTSVQGAETGVLFTIQASTVGIIVPKAAGPLCHAGDVGLSYDEILARSTANSNMEG